MTHLRLSPLLLILMVLNPGRLMAFIDLSITYPRTSFTTNNQVLQIAGAVESSASTDVIVSIDTPAGVPSPPKITHSIHSIFMDLGSVQQLTAALIRPVIERGSLFGPRRIRLAFSEDDSSSTEEHFDIPADLALDRTVVDFSSPIAARFIQIDMLEGWEAERLSIQSIEFLDASDQIIQPIIQSISILLKPTREAEVPFLIEVLLSEGENQISVLAVPLSSDIDEQDMETISVVYLADLQTDAADGAQVVLSDGRQATIVVPVSAFEEDVKKIEFLRESPDQIDSSSYQQNIQIAQGTSPVVVYRFDILRRGSFTVEATSSLSSQPPALAVDGILEPPSTWMAGLVPLPIYLTVDLGDFHTLSQVIVHPNVIDNRSFGPQSATVLVSDDNDNFTNVLDVSDFNDQLTIINLPSRPSTRYVRLEITESKQANNVQLNEVEFFDASGSEIIRFVEFNRLVLERPALLELSYDVVDLQRARVSREGDLRVFTWDPLTREWQLAGGEVDPSRQTVRLELNYITQFAVFQAVPPPDIEARWSLNPFSPDGNGIADITRLMINSADTLQTEQPELVVEIYDLHSKLVKTLINRWVVSSDSISIEWDGKDRNGRTVNIGPYIYQVRLGARISNGVIVVAK